MNEITEAATEYVIEQGFEHSGGIIESAFEAGAKWAGTLPCPCTTFEQSEECPIGYPSLLCRACDGTGNAPIDKVVALAAEMLRVAEQVDELEDPFAAWESIDLLLSEQKKPSETPQ